MSKLNQERFWHLLAWVLLGLFAGLSIAAAFNETATGIIVSWAGALLTVMVIWVTWIRMEELGYPEITYFGDKR